VISPSQGRYLHTRQHRHNKVGFEPTIPGFERVHALHNAATVIGRISTQFLEIGHDFPIPYLPTTDDHFLFLFGAIKSRNISTEISVEDSSLREQDFRLKSVRTFCSEDAAEFVFQNEVGDVRSGQERLFTTFSYSSHGCRL
jgi:hypothetical protein